MKNGTEREGKWKLGFDWISFHNNSNQKAKAMRSKRRNGEATSGSKNFSFIFPFGAFKRQKRENERERERAFSGFVESFTRDVSYFSPFSPTLSKQPKPENEFYTSETRILRYALLELRERWRRWFLCSTLFRLIGAARHVRKWDRWIIWRPRCL